MAYKRISPQPITEGGTGDSSFTSYAVVCGGTASTNPLQSIAGVGTSGQLLTSNGAAALPTFQSAPASSITITGDTGGGLTGNSFTFAGGTTGLSFGGSGSTETLTFAGITANGGTVSLATDATTSTINIGTGGGAKTTTLGSTNTTSTTAIKSGSGGIGLTGAVTSANAITITSGNMVVSSGNVTVPSTSSTVGQFVLNSTAFLHSYGTANTFLGSDGFPAGNFTLTTATAVRNVGIGGHALQSITTGVDDTCVGINAGESITSGGGNLLFGTGCGTTITSGSNNVAIGRVAGFSGALDRLTTGSGNIAIGIAGTQCAGHNYTGAESNNIVVCNLGTTGESNVMRLGTSGSGAGNVNKTFIAGVFGVTVGVSGVPVVVDNADNFGTVVSSIRYKENVQPMACASEQIFDLKPVTFNYKQDKDKHLHYGLIAEDVEKDFSHLVVYNKEGLPESVKYLDLPVLLLNELQKQQQVIKNLVKRVQALEKGVYS